MCADAKPEDRELLLCPSDDQRVRGGAAVGRRALLAEADGNDALIGTECEAFET